MRRFLILLLLTGCAGPQLVDGPVPSGPIRLAICQHGWHTEIGVPRAALTGPLAALKPNDLHAPYLLIGFGAKSYFTALNPSDGQAAEALLPGPSAINLAAFQSLPGEADRKVVWVNVSQDNINRLLAYTYAAMPHAPGAAPAPIVQRVPGSAFYAATPGYSAAYNCNTWAADALHAAGLPITSQGVTWASDVQVQAQAIAAEQGPQTSLTGPP
jgi:hypothetical protein